MIVVFLFLLVVFALSVAALRVMGGAHHTGLLCRLVGHAWVPHHDRVHGFYDACEACGVHRTPPRCDEQEGRVIDVDLAVLGDLASHVSEFVAGELVPVGLDRGDLTDLAAGRVPEWLRNAALIDLARGDAARASSLPLYAPGGSMSAGGEGGARGVSPHGSTAPDGEARGDGAPATASSAAGPGDTL